MNKSPNKGKPRAPQGQSGIFCAMKTVVLLDAAAIDRALTRMAHEIVEHNPKPDMLAFVGIRTHGVPLAQRLAAKVGEICNREFPVGELDISMHRDDLALRESPPSGWRIAHRVRRDR